MVLLTVGALPWREEGTAATMGRYGGLTRLFAAINLLTLLESTGAFKPVVKPLQGQGRADPLWSFASTSQQEEVSEVSYYTH